MKKILHTTIVCLLIPSLVLAQIPQYIDNETAVKQTDLSRVLNALDTEVGQQIISYIETTVGSIDLEHAKAFTTANGEVAFVPIKSFSRMLAALCYRQLEDGAEYLFLITYNASEKCVSFTFPSGQMYVMKSSGITESINPDFQFQQYDDLQNKVSTNLGVSNLSQLRQIVCVPVDKINYMVIEVVRYIAIILGVTFASIFCFFFKEICSGYGGLYFVYLFGAIAIIAISSLLFATPVLLVYTVYTIYPQNSNLQLLSFLFALYYYGCTLMDQ